MQELIQTNNKSLELFIFEQFNKKLESRSSDSLFQFIRVNTDKWLSKNIIHLLNCGCIAIDKNKKGSFDYLFDPMFIYNKKTVEEQNEDAKYIIRRNTRQFKLSDLFQNYSDPNLSLDEFSSRAINTHENSHLTLQNEDQNLLDFYSQLKEKLNHIKPFICEVRVDQHIYLANSIFVKLKDQMFCVMSHQDAPKSISVNKIVTKNEEAICYFYCDFRGFDCYLVSLGLERNFRFKEYRKFTGESKYKRSSDYLANALLVGSI